MDHYTDGSILLSSYRRYHRWTDRLCGQRMLCIQRMSEQSALLLVGRSAWYIAQEAAAIAHRLLLSKDAVLNWGGLCAELRTPTGFQWQVSVQRTVAELRLRGQKRGKKNQDDHSSSSSNSFHAIARISLLHLPSFLKTLLWFFLSFLLSLTIRLQTVILPTLLAVCLFLFFHLDPFFASFPLPLVTTPCLFCCCYFRLNGNPFLLPLLSSSSSYYSLQLTPNITYVAFITSWALHSFLLSLFLPLSSRVWLPSPSLCPNQLSANVHSFRLVGLTLTRNY